MAHPTIEDIPIPERPGGPGWRAYAEGLGVQIAVDADSLGSDESAVSPGLQLPEWLDPTLRFRLLGIRDPSGRLVAFGTYETGAEGDTAGTAWLGVWVLPTHRRAGLGGALFDELESTARAEGRGVLQVYVATPTAGDGPVIRPPGGAGAVPADAPGVAFLRRRGFQLGQVYRMSRVPLPVPESLLEAREREASLRMDGRYAVRTWTGPTPEGFVEGLAELRGRMSTDAPRGSLDVPEDPWTPDRLRDEDERRATAPGVMLTAIAVHAADGAVVAFSQVESPDDRSRPAIQWDTLVAADHRGHRLGWAVKLAVTRLLDTERPGHPSILTENAEENRPMLAVNEAMGFAAIGSVAAWQRATGAADPPR